MWGVAERPVQWAPQHTALLLCDMWDSHWSRGAAERVETMVPRMNQVVTWARQNGVFIVHAPSNTLEFYAGTGARQRALEAPPVAPPAEQERDDPPQPIDSADGGSDTGETAHFKAWSRQHPGIGIDQAQDAITDDGQEVYNLFHARGIKHLLIMGVHTNICVLGRSFAIKQMVKWGLDVALVRDLTDALYNPARPPYVSHDEGTRLVIEFIEKFWCPSVSSGDIEQSCT